MISTPVLQDLVEEMSTSNDDGSWSIDHSMAKRFIAVISKYVKKAVYYSDKYDPEDAYSEVVWNLWVALEKYGPRPWGKKWDQVLKLKTACTLKSRARRRLSDKSRINFHCDSIDCDSDEVVNTRCDNIVADQFDYLYMKEYSNLLSRSADKETSMENPITIGECEIGETYVTRYGKKVQLTGKGETKAKVLVLITDDEVEVPLEYKVFKIFSEPDSEEPVEIDIEKEVKKPANKKIRAKDVLQEVDEDEAEEESEKIEVEAVTTTDDKPAKTKKSTKSKKTTKKETKKGDRIMGKTTAKQLVLDMLRKGPKTRTELATSIIAKGLTENTDIKKVKQYVSVMLSNIKRKDGITINTLEPGKYSIDG